MSTPTSEETFTNVVSLYTALIADAANTSARRQTVNTVYIGVNGIFLTGVGILLISSRLDTWWIVGAMALIAIVVAPLNRAWLRSLTYYERLLSGRYKTMREIEIYHRLTERLLGTNAAMQSPDKAPLVGQAAFAGSPLPYSGNVIEQDRLSDSFSTSSLLEMSLPRYFLWLYPAIAIGGAILVFLTTQHILPAISV
jgi:hypothetical protein